MNRVEFLNKTFLVKFVKIADSCRSDDDRYVLYSK